MALTSFSSGVNTSFSSQLNSNFDKSIIRRNTSSEDTTEYSAALVHSSWTDLGYSKTLTMPESQNLILGFKVVFDVKTSTTNEEVLYRAVLTNDSNSGVIYFYTTTRNVQYSGDSDKESCLTFTNSNTYETKTISAFGIPISISSDYNDSIASNTGSLAAHLDGSSYTLTFEAKGNDYTETPTGYIDETTVTLFWTYVEDDTVSGWA